jgi:hypothetical protein
LKQLHGGQSEGALAEGHFEATAWRPKWMMLKPRENPAKIACLEIEALGEKAIIRRGVRLATVYRPCFSDNGQAYADAHRCVQSIFHTTRDRCLCWGGIGRRAMHDFFDCLSGFACNLGDLLHQVGAEWKYNIRQTSDVGKEGVAVLLNEAAIV